MGLFLGPEQETLAASSSNFGWRCSGGPGLAAISNPIRLVLGNGSWSPFCGWQESKVLPDTSLSPVDILFYLW
jgi:hypothetical protein